MIDILIFIALLILISYYIFVVYKSYKTKNKNLLQLIKIKSSITKGFDSDFKYLNYLIDYHINNFTMIDLNVKNKNLDNKTSYSLIQENDLINFSKNIVNNILNDISDDYRFLLSFYIKDLDDYIVNRVVTELIKISSSYNIMQLNGISKIDIIEKFKKLNNS